MSAATPAIPLKERINFRIITFIAIFGLIFGYVLYLALDSAISGGLKNRGSYFEVDLKAMSTFPFDQDNGRIEDVPPRWRELDGKVVQMVGEIAPGSFTAVGVDGKFDLVYSVAKCCMTGTPQIQHFIKVTVPPGAKAERTTDGAVIVRGKLRVEVTIDPETKKINGVYHVIAEDIHSV